MLSRVRRPLTPTTKSGKNRFPVGRISRVAHFSLSGFRSHHLIRPVSSLSSISTKARSGRL
jgi:hypothetical protein